jgi:CBS domain-containing protein
MIFLGNAYLSNLLGKPVIDGAGKTIGRLRDIVVFAPETYPPVTKIVVRRGREDLVVPLQEVKIVTEDAVTLRSSLEQLSRETIESDELPLAKAILDRQVVDVDGRRVVRVNDLEVANIADRLRLVAVDVGSRGLLRRLGLEPSAAALGRLFGRPLRGKAIAWDHVHMMGATAHPLQLTLARDRLATLHPADLAEIASQLTANERADLFRSLPDEAAAEAITELEPDLQVSVLGDLDQEQASDILEEMPPDEAADLLADLPEHQARDLLGRMEPEEAAEAKALLKYPEDTAGGLMTTEWVALPEGLTGDQAITRLRELAPDAETIYYVYVTDDQGRLSGVLSLRELIVQRGDQPVAPRMVGEVMKVRADADAEEVATLMNKYDLLAVPVVDEQDRLLGIVTVDDVMDLVLPAAHRRRQLRG